MARFNRTYRLLVGKPGSEGHEIKPPFHITFDVVKDASENPNSAQVRIWNLAKDKRTAYEEPDMHVLLYAGYEEEDGATLLASGEITSAYSYKDEGDIITELEFIDGWLAVRDTAVSLGYASGVSASTIIKDTAQQMGLSLDMQDVPDRTWTHGLSFYGAAHELLSKVVRGTGLEWSIQNGVLLIVESGKPKKGTGFVLNAGSGLIGSPQRTRKGAQEKATVKDKKTGDNKEIVSSRQQQDGWRVQSLLLPTLQPNDKIKIESIAVDGWFKVSSVRHSGDWGGSGDWLTEIEVIE